MHNKNNSEHNNNMLHLNVGAYSRKVSNILTDIFTFLLLFLGENKNPEGL